MTQEDATHFTNATQDFKSYVTDTQSIDDYSLLKSGIDTLKAKGIIDTNEQVLIKKLLVMGEKAEQNLISFNDFSQGISDIKQEYENMNYSSSQGVFAGIVLSIADASKDWWIANEDAVPQGMAKTSTIMKDVKGAVGGGIVNGSWQAFNIVKGAVTAFSWGAFGWAMAGGAILASTGVLDYIFG
ncbi:MAG: hypothetical protein EAZ95_01225 [Bacteroidetes bacterium]|nr:MAG: hypothetical protein EAZ95_01225 [Bacteroidota bacterium]